MRNRMSLTALVVTCLVLLPLVPLLEPVLFPILTRASAVFTGSWFGVPVASSADGWLLATPYLDLHITTACSGIRFFVMLLALGAGWMWAGRHRDPLRWLMHIAIILAGASVLTVLANTARFILTSYGEAFCRTMLPPDMSNAIHFAIGILVFLPALILTSLLLEKTRHAR